MTTMADARRQVIGGVDTHKDLHVAAVVDSTGRICGTEVFPNEAAGHRRMLRWFQGHGDVVRVGIEGTGSYGAGLFRFMASQDIEVLEVVRPNRQRRRLKGKSDTIDAEAAARAALAEDLVSAPKAGTGRVEAIRALRIPRNSAMKARTQAANQIHALVDTCPDELREQLRNRSTRDLVTHMIRWRPGPPSDPTSAHRFAMRALARRWHSLNDEIAEIDTHISALVHTVAPHLVAVKGIGIDTAATLLVAAGDNPDRLTSEASFAALCGVSPIDRSSGRNRHHSLNRGGNRDANRALWRVVLVRMGCDPRTRAYVEQRTADGKTKKQIMRCLKRYVARELFPLLKPLDGI